MGHNDDFSYIWSAKVLAETGRVTYNGWATAMLGWQLYLGALFIKLFGFSFTAVHASMLPVAMAAAALMQRILVRLGIGNANAAIATSSLTLSPLFLPLAFSFMSDVPGIFCLLLCLYACLRAIQASTDRAALAWLVFAGLSNALDGTVRQIAWLGVLILIPSTAWIIRRRPRALILGIAVWLVSVVFILGCMHWFKLQPYAIVEPLLGPHSAFRVVIANGVTVIFYTLPILVAFLAAFPWTQRHALVQAAGTAILLLLVCRLISSRVSSFDWLAPFSHDWWTAQGLYVPSILGLQPDVMPIGICAAFSLLAFAALTAFLVRQWNDKPGRLQTVQTTIPGLPSRTLLVLLGPFTLAYLGLILTREHIFDRYYVIVVFIASILMLRLYEATIAPRLPLISVALMLCFAACGVLNMHDLIARQRARLAAANEMIAAGVPRGEFKAGFEYDGWTQIELAGYLNDPRLRVPAGAYHKLPPPSLPPDCVAWFYPLAPAIHARYELSYQPLSCLPLSEFAPVEFTTWLAPRHRAIYILKLPSRASGS